MSGIVLNGVALIHEYKEKLSCRSTQKAINNFRLVVGIIGTSCSTDRL